MAGMLHGKAGFDVGFSKGVQGRQHLRDQYPGRWQSPAEQLRSRWLLSLPGNDVATDLKWKLASSSLVLMPPPTQETFCNVRHRCLII